MYVAEEIQYRYLIFPDDPDGDIINESGNYVIGHPGISLAPKAHHPKNKGAWQLNHQVCLSWFLFC